MQRQHSGDLVLHALHLLFNSDLLNFQSFCGLGVCLQAYGELVGDVSAGKGGDGNGDLFHFVKKVALRLSIRASAPSPFAPSSLFSRLLRLDLITVYSTWILV